MSRPKVCIMVGSALFSILSQRGWSEATILKVVINHLLNLILMVITSRTAC